VIANVARYLDNLVITRGLLLSRTIVSWFGFMAAT